MTGLRSRVGLVALVVLVALSLAIAAAGAELAPTAGETGAPGWLLGPYGEGLGLSGESVIWLERGALVAWALVLACITALPRRLVWGAIAIVIAAFALAPPLLSLDVFSYVSYARLEAVHGLNPYEHAPAAVPGDPATAYVADFRDQVSVYGPLFTLLALPLGLVGVPAAVWTLKGVAASCVLALGVLAARLATWRGADPTAAAALIALNPLVAVHVVGGAHNDALMALILLAAVAGLLAGRALAGGAGLAGAVAIKASALVVAPFALLSSLRRPALAAGFAAAAGVVIVAGLAVFGPGLDEALRVVGDNQENPSRMSVPATLSRELGLGIDAMRGLCIAAFALALMLLLSWTARGGDWVRAAAWAALGLLAASSYLTPWYVIWALPLVAIARDRALVLAAVAFSAFLLVHQVPGLGG